MATMTQWEILKILTKQGQKTQEIREKLSAKGIDLTLRSIQRNLEKLSASFPITSDEKKTARWQWAEDCTQIDLPVMEPNTALTLRMAEHHLAPMLPKSCLDTLQPYMARARNLLEEVSELGVGAWERRVARISRSQHLIPPAVSDEVLDVVFQGVLEKRQISIIYRKIGATEAREMTVHPLGLVFADGVIYLVGTAWEYDDVRQFALHRIEASYLLTDGARSPKGFSLQTYIAEGNFDFPLEGKRVRLQLWANRWLAGHLGECRLSEDQVLTEIEDGFLVEATVQNTLQLQWWLLGQGMNLEVLSPETLRQDMRETIDTLHARYAG